MKLAPIDIANRTFSRKVGGLDSHEVYNFLRDVADQMEQLVCEKERLERDLRQNKDTLGDYADRDESLRSALQAAAKMSDHFREDAEREAKLILQDARQRADIMVRDARDSLKSIYKEIADLKRSRVQFETTLKSLMEAHLDMLEQGRKVFKDPIADEPASPAPTVSAESESEFPEETMIPANLSGQA